MHTVSNKMRLLKLLPCRLAGNRGARGSGDTSKNVIVGVGDKKDQYFKKASVQAW